MNTCLNKHCGTDSSSTVLDGRYWKNSAQAESFEGKVREARVCAEGGQWICWTKDAEYGAAKQEENKAKVTEV